MNAFFIIFLSRTRLEGSWVVESIFRVNFSLIYVAFVKPEPLVTAPGQVWPKTGPPPTKTKILLYVSLCKSSMRHFGSQQATPSVRVPNLADRARLGASGAQRVVNSRPPAHGSHDYQAGGQHQVQCGAWPEWLEELACVTGLPEH